MDFVATGLDFGLGSVSTAFTVGETVAKSSAVARKCHVTITNKTSCYTLCEPRVHVESGKCLEPLSPTIEASSSGEGLFSKTPGTARGAVGVFTYDLCNNSTKKSICRMAVMYKVPFDLNRKAVACAVGVVDVSTECNKELFRRMSKTTDPLFSRDRAKGPSITHTSDFVTIRANMSDCTTSKMKIEVSENKALNELV